MVLILCSRVGDVMGWAKKKCLKVKVVEGYFFTTFFKVISFFYNIYCFMFFHSYLFFLLFYVYNN